MKKKIYLLITMMMVLFPLKVYGATADFSLSCPTSAKKGETVTCSLKAKVTPEAEEKLASVTGTIDLGDKLTGGTTISKTGLELTGEGQLVTNFDVVVKQDVTGEAIVKVTLTEAKDTNGGPITLGEALTATIRIKSSVTTLSSIKVDGGESSCNLGESSCTLPNVKKGTIVLGATPTDNKATVDGIGTKSLKCGSNKIVLKTTAEDGSYNNYTLNVNRTCNEDTTLKDIVLSKGTLSPSFNANTKSYTVDVTSDVDKITIAATQKDATQKVTGTVKNKELKYGENKFTLTVTSEKGTKDTYTITINRQDDRDTNNNLKDLQISEGKLVFNPETKEYEVKVLNEVKTVKVTATAESEKAKVTITNDNKELIEGLNPAIIITVTSEKGEDQIYKIVVNRLKEGETLGDNPNIATITISGYEFNFDPLKEEYTLEIKNEDKLDISYTVEELGTVVEITGNNDLRDGDVIKLTATSLDGTVKEYRIVIEKSSNLIFIIIGSVVGILVIGGLVFLIIKNKKNKNNNLLGTTKEVQTQEREDELLKSMPTLEEAKTLNNFGPTTPVSPVAGTQNLNSYNNYNNYQEQQPVKRMESYQNYSNEEVKRETPVVLKTTDKEPVSLIEEEPTVNQTRVCSICGHRVSTALKTCPYCKRTF